MSRINTFLELAVKQGGSDLHLVAGAPPRIRIHGTLHPVRFRDLTDQDLAQLLLEFMPEKQRRLFEEHQAVDFGYNVEELGRFRVNVFRHLDGMAAALRVIPTEIPTLDGLGVPPAVKLAVSQPKGLSLVTGPTGSGKSTTLAAVVDHVNRTRKGHVVTIEDPIEFVHAPRLCAITQREVGLHVPNFAEALRAAVREDPDVVLVGEMRDPETIALALTAAETGVQVFGTLHTSGAARSIDRIVNVFPPERKSEVRAMLAESLRVLVSQRLLVNAEGTGRVAATEVLVNTPAAAAIIRSGQSHKLNSVIQAGGPMGMQSMDQVLQNLVTRGEISGQEAYENAVDRSRFERLARRDAA